MLFASLFLAGAAPASLSAAQTQIVDVFVQACTKGSAKFRSGTVQSVAYSSLPEALRWWFRAEADGSVHAISEPQRAYLIQTEKPRATGSMFRPEHAEFKRICTVATEGLSTPAAYLSAYRSIMQSENAAAQKKDFWRSKYLTMIMPEFGYELRVRDLDRKFTILSIGWYEDDYARTLLRRLEHARSFHGKERDK